MSSVVGKLWVPLLIRRGEQLWPSEYGDALAWAHERAHLTGTHVLIGPPEFVEFSPLTFMPGNMPFYLVFPVEHVSSAAVSTP